MELFLTHAVDMHSLYICMHDIYIYICIYVYIFIYDGVASARWSGFQAFHLTFFKCVRPKACPVRKPQGSNFPRLFSLSVVARIALLSLFISFSWLVGLQVLRLCLEQRLTTVQLSQMQRLLHKLLLCAALGRVMLPMRVRSCPMSSRGVLQPRSFLLCCLRRWRRRHPRRGGAGLDA